MSLFGKHCQRGTCENKPIARTARDGELCANHVETRSMHIHEHVRCEILMPLWAVEKSTKKVWRIVAEHYHAGVSAVVELCFYECERAPRDAAPEYMLVEPGDMEEPYES